MSACTISCQFTPRAVTRSMNEVIAELLHHKPSSAFIFASLAILLIVMLVDKTAKLMRAINKTTPMDVIADSMRRMEELMERQEQLLSTVHAEFSCVRLTLVDFAAGVNKDHQAMVDNLHRIEGKCERHLERSNARGR